MGLFLRSLEKNIIINNNKMISLVQLRSFRTRDGTALFDYIMTILFCILITQISRIPLTIITLFLFIISIILHKLFHISTPTNQFIFTG